MPDFISFSCPAGYTTRLVCCAWIWIIGLRWGRNGRLPVCVWHLRRGGVGDGVLGQPRGAGALRQPLGGLQELALGDSLLLLLLDLNEPLAVLVEKAAPVDGAVAAAAVALEGVVVVAHRLPVGLDLDEAHHLHLLLGVLVAALDVVALARARALAVVCALGGLRLDAAVGGQLVVPVAVKAARGVHARGGGPVAARLALVAPLPVAQLPDGGELVGDLGAPDGEDLVAAEVEAFLLLLLHPHLHLQAE